MLFLQEKLWITIFFFVLDFCFEISFRLSHIDLERNSYRMKNKTYIHPLIHFFFQSSTYPFLLELSFPLPPFVPSSFLLFTRHCYLAYPEFTFASLKARHFVFGGTENFWVPQTETEASQTQCLEVKRDWALSWWRPPMMGKQIFGA